MENHAVPVPPSALPTEAAKTSAKEFRYHAKVSAYAGCPPAPAAEPLGVGYRFVKADIEEESNWLPSSIKNPAAWKNKPAKVCCSALALSMYSTLDGLVAAARAGVDSSPNFLKRLGDYYARVKLTSECGRQTVPRDNGHFDLHEYTSFDRQASVVEHKALEL